MNFQRLFFDPGREREKKGKDKRPICNLIIGNAKIGSKVIANRLHLTFSHMSYIIITMRMSKEEQSLMLYKQFIDSVLEYT